MKYICKIDFVRIDYGELKHNGKSEGHLKSLFMSEKKNIEIKWQKEVKLDTNQHKQARAKFCIFTAETRSP